MSETIDQCLIPTRSCLIPTSPYYLHPGENSRLILVSLPFNETNYNTWSKNMKRILLSKNKFKFIDGSISKPSDNDSTFEALERCNVRFSHGLQEL